MTSNGIDRPPRRVAGRRVLPTLVLGPLLLLAVSGCASEDLPRLGMPSPVTDHGARILSLWQGSWAAALVVGGIVWGLIVWSVIFHRRRSAEAALPPQVRYNIPIEVLYTVLPFIVVAVLFYFTARDETKVIALKKAPAHTVNVVGRQWSWTFNYVGERAYDVGTPGQRPTLYLAQGERVRFELTSPDTVHSFWVPAFVFKLDVIPGRTNVFEVTPNREGTFAGRCAELCGVDHSTMLFTVKVVSPEAFDAHISDLKANGQSGVLRTGRTSNDANEQGRAGNTQNEAQSAPSLRGRGLTGGGEQP